MVAWLGVGLLRRLACSGAARVLVVARKATRAEKECMV